MNNLVFINIGTAEMFMLVIMSFLVLIPLIMAGGALWDLHKRDFSHKTTDKILIILLILCAPFIGTLVYILIIRNHYPVKLAV